MRKDNAEFKGRFLSCEGTLLHNNDYYGSSELDDYACYVVADGVRTGNNEDHSARLAVEAVIAAFNENPSMGGGAIGEYLKKAHKALRADGSKHRLKASVTVVVTDYQKLRYAHAGNCRFHLYRSSRMIHESKDQSLSWEMMEEGKLSRDKLARHEERNNLYSYLGQMKRLSPRVSKKLKLKDGDILAFFTRGVWENCDHGDMLASIQEAENDPDQALENIERLILDRNPGKEARIDNYTLCTVFVDKVFVNPNKGKLLKTLMTIAIPVLLILAILLIVMMIRHSRREEKRGNMEAAYLNAIEYIQDNNYLRAKEEIDAAHILAAELKDQPKQVFYANYQKLIEAVINADDLLDAANYEAAQEAYMTAEKRSRYADNLSVDYIAKRMDKALGYINVNDLIILGDALADQQNYDMAEQKYLSARSLAASIYFAEGKQQAIDALESLYQRMQQQLDAESETYAEQTQTELTAAEFIVQGDNAFKTGDLTGAKVYYQMATEKYADLGSDDILDALEDKMALIEEKEAENRQRLADAAAYVQKGDALMDKEQYVEAKKQYILARDIYSGLEDEAGLTKVQSKIDLVDSYIAASARLW